MDFNMTYSAFERNLDIILSCTNILSYSSHFKHTDQE